MVMVEPGPDTVQIVVDDDGPGFGRVPRRTGIGLTETRRELGELGGTLTTGMRSPLGGARVVLALPLLVVDRISIAVAT